MVQHMVGTVLSVVQERNQRKEARILLNSQHCRGHNSSHCLWSTLVAIRHQPPSRPGGSSLLRSIILGFPSSLPSNLHIPTRMNDARKRKVFWNVPFIFILHGSNPRRPTNGVSPSNTFLHHNLLDGWSESDSWILLVGLIRSAIQCAACTRARASHWSIYNGLQGCCHT